MIEIEKNRIQTNTSVLTINSIVYFSFVIKNEQQKIKAEMVELVR